MKQVKIRIKGTAPLIQHQYVMAKNDEVKKKDKQYDPEIDAKAAMYYDEKIGAYIPSTYIEASLREAAKNFKNGKSNHKSTIMGSVFCDQDKIPLEKKTYDEIDQRPVVVQRNRIVRSRPRFNSWDVAFTLNYDESRINAKSLRDILIEAGKVKGIGDYRPKFGRFEVTEFVD